MSQETTPVSADSDSSNSSSLAPNSNIQFSQAAQAAAQAAQASKASQQASEPIHRYGDRNSSWQAQSDSDNNWGLPVKNLSPQRIALLNRQAQAEVRLPPFMLFPLSLVVMVCAVCIGVWQAWDLDPNDVDERMELAKFCGTSIEMFGASLMSVAFNYAYSSLAGCLGYLLPCFIAHFVAFGHDALLNLRSDLYQNKPPLFFMQTIWAEICKFASMVVILGIFFKFTSASNPIIVCSFIALIVLTMIVTLIRAIRASYFSPEAIAALSAASQDHRNRDQ